jgi:repressor LexA
MKPLTARQAEVLKFIRKFLVKNYRTPYYREICTEFGWSNPSAVLCHLKGLVRKGRIELRAVDDRKGPQHWVVLRGVRMELFDDE